ncbi:MAG TPA: pyridoxamine 5'-phosphate oxidase family protein [Acidimicrobiales bacterium]|jgi:predicted pyridoxine 5'-phosphate oxidase superfamily flavin-nucleotide-binding protein
MTDPSPALSSPALDAYVRALSSPGVETIEALGAHLAEGVVVRGPVAPGSGRQAVLEALGAPNSSRLLAAATWGEATVDDGEISLEAALPAGSPIAGLLITAALDGSGKLVTVGQQMIPAPPPPAVALELTPEIATAVNGAAANGTPVVVAYVDRSGSPHLSLRGSVQTHGDHALAMWIRDPKGGLLAAIESNPALALWYRDPATRTSYQFAGTARADDDPSVRDEVYDNSIEGERNLDPRRQGVAVIVELQTVEGSGPGGRFRMTRDAT